MCEGFVIGEVICDECGQVVDICFIELNLVFEMQIGLLLYDMIGCLMWDINFDIFGDMIVCYVMVIDSGQVVYFEVQLLWFSGCWFEVCVCFIGDDCFVVLFMDVIVCCEVEQVICDSEESLCSIV